MIRRIRRRTAAAIALIAFFASAVCWASKVHQPGQVELPFVRGDGTLDDANSTTATIDLIINTNTGRYHGTATGNVTNSSGKKHTFHDISLPLKGVTKSTYTVQVNGDAKVVVHGVGKK